jgi:hypothetical protein
VEIYQVRLEERDATRPAWRRMLIPSYVALRDLHLVLETAMVSGSWFSDYYDFTVRRIEYGPKEASPGSWSESFTSQPFGFDDREVTLALALPRPNLRMAYSFNYSDVWTITVILQRSVPANADARYPTCVAGAGWMGDEDGEEINLDDVNRALGKLTLTSLTAEPHRSATAGEDFRKREGPKSPVRIGSTVLELADTVKDRPALAVRNAALIIQDTAWAVLCGLRGEVDDSTMMSALPDAAEKAAAKFLPGSAGKDAGTPTTVESILGISPDLATLHAGISESEARQATDRAIAWCDRLLDLLLHPPHDPGGVGFRSGR